MEILKFRVKRDFEVNISGCLWRLDLSLNLRAIKGIESKFMNFGFIHFRKEVRAAKDHGKKFLRKLLASVGRIVHSLSQSIFLVLSMSCSLKCLALKSSSAL